MCIAIVTEKKVEKEIFDRCWLKNPHGFGMAWTEEDREVHVWKTLESPAAAWAEYSRVADSVNRGKNMLLHFRIKTSGQTDLNNCHPFLACSNKVALIHNGIMGNMPTTADHSDTWHFSQLIDMMSTRFLESPLHVGILEKIIGSGNKVCFLRYDGEAIILNESAGNWSADKKTWYSNDGWKEAASYTRSSFQSSSSFTYSERQCKTCSTWSQYVDESGSCWHCRSQKKDATHSLVSTVNKKTTVLDSGGEEEMEQAKKLWQKAYPGKYKVIQKKKNEEVKQLTTGLTTGRTDKMEGPVCYVTDEHFIFDASRLPAESVAAIGNTSNLYKAQGEDGDVINIGDTVVDKAVFQDEDEHVIVAMIKDTRSDYWEIHTANVRTKVYDVEPTYATSVVALVKSFGGKKGHITGVRFALNGIVKEYAS